MARARGEERDELHNATGQKTSLPRAASTVYFSLDDDGDVLAARPDRLCEVRPKDRVLRRTVEQNVDAVTFPSLDVREPEMGNQLVEVLQKIDTRTSHQVIKVPKIFPDSVPQRLVERRPPQMAEQLVGVPDGASVCTFGSRLEGLFEARASWPSLRTGFNSVWVRVFGGDR